MKSRSKVFNRRVFLVASSTAALGLTIGFRDLLDDSKEAKSKVKFQPNGWLSINDQGHATIKFSRSEMGQGISTTLPMLVAEELSIDWRKVSIEQASYQPNIYGGQWAHSNSSLISSWHTLRTAGAVARTMLVRAAAQKWNVSINDCEAMNSEVIHNPTQKKN